MAPRTPREEAVVEEAVEEMAEVEAAIEAEVEEFDLADRGNRIARTGVQVGSGAILTTLLTWGSSFLPWDLDPLDPNSAALPAEVVAAMVAAITLVAAWRMNRPG
jgi:hypothetical protein